MNRPKIEIPPTIYEATLDELQEEINRRKLVRLGSLKETELQKVALKIRYLRYLANLLHNFNEGWNLYFKETAKRMEEVNVAEFYRWTGDYHRVLNVKIAELRKKEKLLEKG